MIVSRRLVDGVFGMHTCAAMAVSPWANRQIHRVGQPSAEFGSADPDRQSPTIEYEFSFNGQNYTGAGSASAKTPPAQISRRH